MCELTLVNFEQVSSASLIRFALNIYLAHLELIYLSAVSKPCASSNHLYASSTSPACCTEQNYYSQSAMDKLCRIKHYHYYSQCIYK